MTDDKKLCKRCGLTIHRSPYGSWIHSETTEARCNLYASRVSAWGDK